VEDHTAFRADDAGICLSTLHVTPRHFVAADVVQLARVAADAGFPSVALQSDWATIGGVDATRALLDDLGLTVSALESAITWSAGTDAAHQDADQLLDTASALGARVLHAVSVATELDSLSRAIDGFATLCERARAHEIDVSIEFIPWYGIPDLATAWQIVRGSEASNGGICIDFQHWHCQPEGPDLDLLRSIPGECISYVQPTDAPLRTAAVSPDTYMAECLTDRPVPGEGAIDIPPLMDALRATGADPVIAYQVCNPDLAETGAAAMAARLRANAAMLFA
jgi:sugar phosphate isomerase/epimerase